MCYISEAAWIRSRKLSFLLAPRPLLTGYCEGHHPQVVLALTVYGQCRLKEAVMLRVYDNTKRAFKVIWGSTDFICYSPALYRYFSLHFILLATCEHAQAPTTSFTGRVAAILVTDFLLDIILHGFWNFVVCKVATMRNFSGTRLTSCGELGNWHTESHF